MEDRRVEVVFIRHAESEDNVKIKALCEALLLIQSLKFPTWEQVSKIVGLLEFELNSKLSQLGSRQAADMKMILKTRNFWKQNFDLVAYSPLVRARETSRTILPEDVFERSECLDLLREISPFEQLVKSCVAKKIQDFEHWLAGTDLKRILIVGHCQYFNSLLGMKTLMRNCDVWESTVTFPVSLFNLPPVRGQPSQCVWAAPVLLHRSGLSEPHPVGKLFKGALKGWGGWGPEEGGEDNDTVEEEDDTNASAQARNRDGDSVVNDLDDNSDELVCRFCQAPQSEAPQRRMIKPCRCSGSVSHVHLDCLNTWRASSTHAFYRCSVCQYEYRLQRTLIATLLMQEEVVMVVAALMILGLCLVLGLVAACAIAHWQLPIDPVHDILTLMNVDRFWMRCILSNRQSHIPSPASYDLAAVLRAVYQQSDGVHEVIRGFVRVLRSPLPMVYFLCHPLVSAVLNTFLLGALPVGVVGFGGYFIGLVNQMRRGGQGWTMQVAFLLAWFASLSVKSVSRLCLVVGCLIATREVYVHLVVRARQLSNWFGDLILEPN